MMPRDLAGAGNGAIALASHSKRVDRAMPEPGRPSMNKPMRTRTFFKSLTVIAVLILGVSVSATEQERDLVRYADKRLWMLERPLKDFLRQLPAIPRFDIADTANYKGYTAGWEIKECRLYLASFSATTNNQPFSIGLLFPERKLPFVADWYSGRIHIPSGKKTFAQGRYTFERVTILHVTNGVVITTNEMKHVREDRLHK
ncbi:MAG TPA: hypothetical protein VN673_07175 [Clostridia bacterium]|nr:hypothetical protein [Clostridia bacterium]